MRCSFGRRRNTLKRASTTFSTLAEGCRFRDCRHANEPGCAVLEAGLDAARLENYQKMQRELAYVERKTDPRLAKETKAKWKAIEKSMRNSVRPKKE